MWSIAAALLSWVLGLFGFGKKEERDIERKASEFLGIQKTENTNAKAGLSEVQTAVAAWEENRTAVAADPGRLLDGSDPAAATLSPRPGLKAHRLYPLPAPTLLR